MTNTAFPYIPWHTAELWQEVNGSFQYALNHNNTYWPQAKEQAHRLTAALDGIASLMDELCRITCPACTDVCCHHATVWFDFRDLLFFQLADIPVPAGQLICHRDDRCRYANSDGCSLERIQRPFICTHYLCPAQTRILRLSGQGVPQVQEELNRIKQGRRDLENIFVQAVFPKISDIAGNRC